MTNVCFDSFSKRLHERKREIKTKERKKKSIRKKTEQKSEKEREKRIKMGGDRKRDDVHKKRATQRYV